MASHRRTVAAAVAVVLASLSLYPIFTGLLWFFAGLGAIAVVALTGTVTRLRRLPVPLTVLAPVSTLLLYLNLGFSSRRSLLHMLPTPSSLHDLWHVAGQGFTEAGKYAPPVPELRGMVLLAAAGIGITAVATDLIGVRLGSAALAGLPLLLLFTEPFTLSVARGAVGTIVVFCATVAGYLGLLSSESRDRIREWEHPGPNARNAPDTRPLAAAGRRVGIAAVAVALCLPLVIPGLHTTRLFGGQPGIGGSGGSGGSGNSATAGLLDPNTQLSKELHQSQASTLLVYKTADPIPDYLQLYVLDHLTDSGWQLFSAPKSLAPVNPRLPAPPGLAPNDWVTKETTTITVAPDVGGDFLTALPVPYPATTVTARGPAHGTTGTGAWRADKDTLMVFASPGSLGGLTYTVNSLASAPPPSLLAVAVPAPADIKAHYLAVPPAYDSLRAVAQSVIKTAGAKDPFDEAVAVQNWLANGNFSYTLNAPTVLTAAALRNFLTVTKRGYCQQFSFAMAVLARLLDIPSRVAYGFTSGTAVGDDEWQVTTHDAHAWPELYFQGYGWLRFEPTPGGPSGQGSATTPTYALPAAGSAPPLTGGATTGTTPSTQPSGKAGGLSALQRQLNLALHDDGGLGTGAGADTVPVAAKHGGSVNPWVVVGLVLAGLLVLGGVAPWCARLIIRRRRWRHPGRISGRPGRISAGDVAWAHAAWRELRDDLIDYGADYRPSESPRAVATRAGAELRLEEPAQAALGRIALAEERARYSAQPADGSGLHADSVTVRRAIAAAVPGQAKWRARLLPGSVVGPALAALASAVDLYRGVRGAVPSSGAVSASGAGGHDRAGRRRSGWRGWRRGSRGTS